MVWAGVTVIVPILSADIDLNTDAWLTFTQRFFIVIVLTIPFEIRDLQYDVASLKTLPQQLGLTKVKALGVFLLIICLFMEEFKDGFSTRYFLSLLIVCLLIAAVLSGSSKKQFKYFASFWVEAIPIVWLGILLLLRYLF